MGQFPRNELAPVENPTLIRIVPKTAFVAKIQTKDWKGACVSFLSLPGRIMI